MCAMHQRDASHLTLSVALEDVRSAHNVGAIFRTADAAGVSAMHLIGTTPTPIDRFGRQRSDITKTALGAERSIPWTYHESADDFVRTMRDSAREIIVVEQDVRARDLLSVSPVSDGVVVFGNEVTGVSERLRAAADQLVSIPMYGSKESLNVSVAAGIALYHYRHIAT